MLDRHLKKGLALTAVGLCLLIAFSIGCILAGHLVPVNVIVRAVMVLMMFLCFSASIGGYGYAMYLSGQEKPLSRKARKKLAYKSSGCV